MRHPDQPPVARIAPGMIGAGQHLGAARLAVDQPRSAMAADIGEGAHLAVVAANDDDAFAEIFERSATRPARRCRFRGRRPAARRAGTRASPPRRIRGRDRASRAGSCRRAGRAPGSMLRRCVAMRLALAISRALRQWAPRWGDGYRSSPLFFLERQPEGRSHWCGVSDRPTDENKHAALRACFPRASGSGPGPGRCARGKRHQDHRPTMAGRSSRPRPGAFAASPTASPRTARRITSMLDVDAPPAGDRRARAPDRTSTRTSSAS